MAKTWQQATEALRAKAQKHFESDQLLSAQAYTTAADYLDHQDRLPFSNKVNEYWIWSNEHGAWWRPHRVGYTIRLHEAGRYSKFMVDEILAQCNLTVAPDEWPREVAIPVVNMFMSTSAQAIMESVDEG